MLMRTLTICIVVTSLLLSMASLSRADDDDVDMDEVLKSVRSGAAMPLAAIRRRISDRIDGEIVRIEVKREHGHLVYEVRVLNADGKLVEVEVDAASGRILEIENE